MCKTTASFLALMAILGLLTGDAAAADGKPGATLFVAPGGNDAWSGKQAVPNTAWTDGPLATLAKAQEKIRGMKRSAPLPMGGITVVVRGGTYFLPKTLELGPADSGTAASPIVYRGAQGEQPRIFGGRPITGFVPYRDSILKANVAAQGFHNIRFRQLFFDGKLQQLARYPNFDPQNPYGGGWAYADQDGKVIPWYTDHHKENHRTFRYREKDARQWSHPEEGEVFVFPFYNYWNNILPIASIDRQKREITLAGDASYPIRPGDRYYVRNLLEELDTPGEWYLDGKSETLYFWPPAELKGRVVCAPTLRTLIAIGPGTSHVTIRGLDLQCCEGTAVTVRDACDCLIAGNTIHHTGSDAVSVSGGQRIGVVGNDIYEVGSAAIVLRGGDRRTLTPAGHYADNNYIHHTGVIEKAGVGVWLEGVGNRATHNLIHDSPRIGIQFEGNNLAMEYNHVRHVGAETEDIGIIYTGGRDWISSRGSRISYNYFHDILGYGRSGSRWISPYFARGIYLDDNAGGVDVIGNIVARAVDGVLMLHNSRNSRFENNIFIDGTLHQVNALGWTATHPFWTNTLPQMLQGYASVLGQPAWRNMPFMELPPEKAVLPSGLVMANNVLLRNIFYYHNPKAKLYQLSNFPLDHNQSDYNLAYHFGHPVKIQWEVAKEIKTPASVPAKRDAPTDRWPAWWQAQGLDRHSLVGDPLFVDPDKGDYRLRPNSPALRLGFKPIPLEKIGPYADPLRASWPIREAEGVREKPLVSKS